MKIRSVFEALNQKQSQRESNEWCIVLSSSYSLKHMWCEQAKSVWSQSNSVFIFLTKCMHHSKCYILQKAPLKLANWFQRYEQLKNAKNNRKQKTFSALFGSILKSIFPTSDWFCFITSHISDVINVLSFSHLASQPQALYLGQLLFKKQSILYFLTSYIYFFLSVCQILQSFISLKEILRDCSFW